jgi:integrase
MEKNNYLEVMRDLQGYFKSGERKSLYNSCDSLRDKVLIRLLWKTGRRVGEILMLKVGDINFEDRHILWTIEKKKKLTKRIKPIDEFTLKLLKFYIGQNDLKPFDLVIPISRQRVFQIVRRLGSKSDVNYVGNKRIHPHHFRHTFAIDMVKRSSSAADIRKVQQLLEHSNLNTTESYLQFGSEDLREMIEQEDD